MTNKRMVEGCKIFGHSPEYKGNKRLCRYCWTVREENND